MPPSAPKPAARPKLASTTRPVSMPTSRAASGLWAAASIALPWRVWLKKAHKAAATAQVTPRIHKDCGWSTAPLTTIGASPLIGGSEWKFLPRRTPAIPRSRIEAPMVTMIRLTTVEPRAGTMPKRWRAKPTRTAMSTAAAAASGKGRPAAATNTVPIPPSMTNSPWAKLMTWLALKTSEKPTATRA